MSDLFMGLDRESRIVFVNRRLHEFSGGDAEHFLGLTPYDLWPTLRGTEAEANLAAASDKGEARHFAYYYAPTDTHLEVRVHAVGEYLHLYFRDVTTRKEMESRLESEQDVASRWRALFDQTSVCLATTDIKTGVITQMNRAYEDLTGYTQEELHSMTFVQLTHPEDREGNLREVDKLLTGEVPTTTFRKRYVRKDGQSVWVQVSLSLIRNPGGQAVSYAVVTHDITEMVALEEQHRQANDSMSRSEQRLRTILEASTTGVVLNDAQGKFLYANAPMLRLVGYSVKDLQAGRLSWTLIQDPERRAHDDQALEQLRDVGQCVPFETELIRKDGSHVPVYMGGAFVPDDSGEGYLGAAFVTDLTALRDAFDEVVRLNAELDDRVQKRTADLQRANDEMAAFTYHVSHDLRAPLRAIVATSRILLQDHTEELNPEATGLLERQSVAANKLGKLIDELLKLTRLSREESHYEQLDLSKLAREIATEHKGENARVKVVVDDDLWAEGDPRLMRLVFENLISNAYLYSPNGGTVHVGCSDTSHGPAFYVSDQGIGFDMQYAHKLFQPFERLVSEADYPGTGVGLANVARIVSKHGGQVWAQSEPGKGATFYFTLR